jgi:hypothetical protein
MSLLARVTALFLIVLFDSGIAVAQTSIARVYADGEYRVHILAPSGREFVVRRKLNQSGVDAIKISDDRRTAGWLVLYRQPFTGSPIAAELAVWRDGHVVRTFKIPQTFWSWTFDATGPIAYHVGPTHGEPTSRCELHDVKTGRMVAKWDGDLSDPNRPAWAKRLEH